MKTTNSRRLNELLEKSQAIEIVESVREAINNNGEALLDCWLTGKLNITQIHDLFIEAGYKISYGRFSILFRGYREQNGYKGSRYDLVEKSDYVPTPRKTSKKQATVSSKKSKPESPYPVKQDPVVFNLREQLLYPNAKELSLKEQREKKNKK